MIEVSVALIRVLNLYAWSYIC